MAITLTAAALPQLLQAVQLTFSAVRAMAAAARAAGQDVPSDEELIRLLSSNSAEGIAEADALIARLQAAPQ